MPQLSLQTKFHDKNTMIHMIAVKLLTSTADSCSCQIHGPYISFNQDTNLWSELNIYSHRNQNVRFWTRNILKIQIWEILIPLSGRVLNLQNNCNDKSAAKVYATIALHMNNYRDRELCLKSSMKACSYYQKYATLKTIKVMRFESVHLDLKMRLERTGHQEPNYLQNIVRS